jgi:hypothetical protein
MRPRATLSTLDPYTILVLLILARSPSRARKILHP